MDPQSAFFDELSKIAASPVFLSYDDALRIHTSIVDELATSKLASAELDALYKEMFLEKVAWPGSKLVNIGGESFDFSPQSALSYKNIGKHLQNLGAGLRLPSGVNVETAAAAGNQKGILGRVLGESLHSAGHHMAHASTVGKVMNPLGKPMGGAIEGVARGVGQELARAQSAQPLTGGVRSAVGGALQRYAPRIGQAGELLGGAATATALGSAVSPAAAGLSAVAKGTGLYGPMHHALGTFGTHLAKDVTATGLEGAAGAAARALT